MTELTASEWVERLAAPAYPRQLVQESAYAALHQLGAAALPALIDGLGHADWRVRCGAAYLLAELGPAAARARHALRRTLTDVRARVRRAAAEAMRRVGPAARDVAPSLLVRAVADPDPQVRTVAARAVGEVAAPEPQVVSGLLGALNDVHAPARSAAAAALGNLGGGIEAVARELDDQFILDVEARPEVAAALARVAPERLVRHAVHNRDCFLAPRCPRFTSNVVMRLAALGAGAAPVRQVFVEMLSTPARAEALYGLARVGAAARDMLPAIAQKLDKPARAALRAIYLASWAAPDPDGPRERILVARLQAGDVARERVELAAALGDSGSLSVLGRPCLSGDVDALDAESFRAWSDAMKEQPPEVRARIGHAVARDVLPLWQEMYLTHVSAEDTVHALEDWLAFPSPASVERLRQAEERFFPTQWCTSASFAAAWAILSVARAVLDVTPQMGSLADGIGLGHAARAWRACSGVALGNVFGGPARPFNEPLTAEQAIRRVREVVRARVVPWALDEGDPIRESLSRLLEDYPDRMR